MLSLSEIQKRQRAWAERNFGAQPTHRPLLGVIEEVGELAHAQLKYEQQIRAFDHGKFVAEARDAVGDIVIYLLDYCNRNGWDLTEVLNEAWKEVSKRDWKKDPHQAGTKSASSEPAAHTAAHGRADVPADHH